MYTMINHARRKKELTSNTFPEMWRLPDTLIRIKLCRDKILIYSTTINGMIINNSIW